MDPVLLTTFGTLIVLLIFTVPIGVSIGTAVFMGMMVGGLPPVFLVINDEITRGQRRDNPRHSVTKCDGDVKSYCKI